MQRPTSWDTKPFLCASVAHRASSVQWTNNCVIVCFFFFFNSQSDRLHTKCNCQNLARRAGFSESIVKIVYLLVHIILNVRVLIICLLLLSSWHTICTQKSVVIYIHTYHSRFIPEGVAEISQIFLRDTHVLQKLAMRNTADETGGKPIAVLLQSISGVSAINPLVAFYDIHGGKR
jgi:hypothetical protein